MKCPTCNSEDLMCTVTITRAFSLAKRGGNLALRGGKITQPDIKNAWAKTGPGNDKIIRGPIFCTDCDEELFYVQGAKHNPYKGSYKDAEEMGAEHFIEGGDLEGN